jgi:hypothetical protein
MRHGAPNRFRSTQFGSVADHGYAWLEMQASRADRAATGDRLGATQREDYRMGKGNVAPKRDSTRGKAGRGFFTSETKVTVALDALGYST